MKREPCHGGKFKTRVEPIKAIDGTIRCYWEVSLEEMKEQAASGILKIYLQPSIKNDVRLVTDIVINSYFYRCMPEPLKNAVLFSLWHLSFTFLQILLCGLSIHQR